MNGYAPRNLRVAESVTQLLYHLDGQQVTS